MTWHYNWGAITEVHDDNVYRNYHDITGMSTSTMSNDDFRNLFTYYLKDVFLDPTRLRYALEVQEQYLTPEEMSLAYSVLLGRKINDPRHAFRHVLEG